MKGPLPYWPDLSCSPAMIPAQEETEAVLTDGYCSSPRQSGGTQREIGRMTQRWPTGTA